MQNFGVVGALLYFFIRVPMTMSRVESRSILLEFDPIELKLLSLTQARLGQINFYEKKLYEA